MEVFLFCGVVVERSSRVTRLNVSLGGEWEMDRLLGGDSLLRRQGFGERERERHRHGLTHMDTGDSLALS